MNQAFKLLQDDSSGLIVPLWNWNGGDDTVRHADDGFNRTFMELKLDKDKRVGFPCAGLIVPLWNWNFDNFDAVRGNNWFNRTFMELKSVYNVLFTLETWV